MNPGRMDVTRVHVSGGSTPEPPLDQSWDDLDKLRWKAGLTTHDAGVDVRAYPSTITRRVYRRHWWRLRRVAEWEPVLGVYDIQVGSRTSGAFSFLGAWEYMNGVEAGARAVRNQTLNPQGENR